MGTTAIGLAERFGCHIEGVDLDVEQALAKAQKISAKQNWII